METSDPQIDEIENKEENKEENNEDAPPEESLPEVEIPEPSLDVEHPPSPVPKKRGRPPGAKNKAKASSGRKTSTVDSAPPPPSIVSSAPSTAAATPPTVEDVASIMLDMLQERQASRRNAKRQLYRSFLDL